MRYTTRFESCKGRNQQTKRPMLLARAFCLLGLFCHFDLEWEYGLLYYNYNFLIGFTLRVIPIYHQTYEIQREIPIF